MRKYYPNASDSKIRRLYDARQSGISQSGFKRLANELK
jgi:hypothetical protein